MRKLTTLFCLLVTALTMHITAQIPSNVDPGNPRGDEGTTYFWDQPEVYIPALIAVVVLMVIFWVGRKRKK